MPLRLLAFGLFGLVVFTAGWLAVSPAPGYGQAPEAPTTSAAPSPATAGETEEGDGGPSTADSNVGYIDSALIGDLFRLRFDAA
jgi:hypothetical protein